MLPCIRSVVTFSLVLTAVSIHGATESLNRKGSGSEDPFGALQLHEGVLIRNKRKFIELNAPIPFKYAPDYWPRVPSPSPGRVGLDDIIFESNDGRYHGLSRKYTGEAANILAITTKPKIEDYVPLTTQQFGANKHEGLRLLQGAINRMKLQTTVSSATKRTTPIYAPYFDPNFYKFPPLTNGSRRMMGEAEIDLQKQVPPKVVQFNEPKITNDGTLEMPPFEYDPENFANFDSWTRRIPTTLTPNLNYPLKLFNFKYGTTTKRRPRTRRTKAKTTTTMTIMPMKDNEYPEEMYMDDDFTTPRSTSRPQGTPLLGKTVIDDDVDDTTTANIRHAPVKNETKNVYIKPVTHTFETEKDMSDLNYAPNISDMLSVNTPKHEAIDPLMSGFRKIDIDSELIDPKLVKDFEESKVLNKTLFDKISNDTAQTNPNIGKNKKQFEYSLTESKINQTSRRQFGEMNEDLKPLLIPDDEMIEALAKFQLPNNADYLDPDDIRGLPIRRRRSKRNIAPGNAVEDSSN